MTDIKCVRSPQKVLTQRQRSYLMCTRVVLWVPYVVSYPLCNSPDAPAYLVLLSIYAGISTTYAAQNFFHTLTSMKVQNFQSNFIRQLCKRLLSSSETTLAKFEQMAYFVAMLPFELKGPNRLAEHICSIFAENTHVAQIFIHTLTIMKDQLHFQLTHACS